MYKLLSVNQSVATRTLKLENMSTGTIDVCFDDSALTTFENFGFMEISKEYDCKIALFGDVVEKKNDKSISCRVLDTNVSVGEKILIRVKLCQDIYYLPKGQLENCTENQIIEYSYTRKDLIQVNNVVHGDLLTTLW